VVALGDFNSDGTLDLVAAGSTLHSTFIGYDENGSPIYEEHADCYGTVLLGNGDGTFLLAAANPMPPISGDAGDFNNDGRLDLLTASGVLPGNGDGTFGAFVPPTHYVGLGGASHPVGDFNGDGKLDVLAGTAYGPILALGNGDGTFRQGQWLEEFDGGLAFVATAAGDVNADGKLDIVAIPGAYDYDEFTTTRSMWVLLGHGDGSFAPVVSDLGTFPGIGYITSAVLADFDADGLPDLATSDVYSPHDAIGSIYRGPFVARNDGIWTVPPQPPPSITMSDVSVSEGNADTRVATFTVTLSAGYSQPVTVAYATANGTAAASDYRATSGTVTFAPGETSKTITVLVNGDRFGEANETFFVNLSSPTNATIADGQAVGTIVDDEPRISISGVVMAEGKKGRTTLFIFAISLSATYDQAVTTLFRTADGTAKTSDSDYVARTGTLTFAPGQTTKTITIEVKGDSKREPSEYFYLDLFGNSTNSLFTQSRGTGTILSDDN
jgi:hypothetical protein